MTRRWVGFVVGGGLIAVAVALGTMTVFGSASAYTFGLLFGFLLAAAGGLVAGRALKAGT